MLATNYHYAVTPHPTVGVDVVLRSNDGLKEKHFYVATASVWGMTRHMESLTDDCCDGFFPKPRKPKPKVE